MRRETERQDFRERAHLGVNGPYHLFGLTLRWWRKGLRFAPHFFFFFKEVRGKTQPRRQRVRGRLFLRRSASCWSAAPPPAPFQQLKCTYARTRPLVQPSVCNRCYKFPFVGQIQQYRYSVGFLHNFVGQYAQNKKTSTLCAPWRALIFCQKDNQIQEVYLFILNR